MANIPQRASSLINQAKQEDTWQRDVAVSVGSSLVAAYVLASVLGGGR